MLHSFSHLLLTAISLECGYPASSLRERIFVSEGCGGILIYTGSSDAEGTLGGLVQAGREIRRHVRMALEAGKLCSNDPVCSQHEYSVHDEQPLNGAACHGCLLISESACQQILAEPRVNDSIQGVSRAPDVVFMKWNGYPKGGEKAALGRAWDKTKKSWIPVTRAQ